MASSEPKLEPSSAGEVQVGYSIDPVRYAIWNDFKNLGKTKLELYKEYAVHNKQVKVKTALKALNELSSFIEDSLIEEKNKRHYHNKQLENVSKFMLYYFVPQFEKIGEYLRSGTELMPAGQEGFSLVHYTNWKNFMGLFVEVSGISKFERAQAPPAEFGYGAS